MIVSVKRLKSEMRASGPEILANPIDWMSSVSSDVALRFVLRAARVASWHHPHRRRCP